MRACERCGAAAYIDGKGVQERFCRECKKAVVREMRAAGYLKDVGRYGKPRTQEQREDQQDTKRGLDR